MVWVLKVLIHYYIVLPLSNHDFSRLHESQKFSNCLCWYKKIRNDKTYSLVPQPLVLSVLIFTNLVQGVRYVFNTCHCGVTVNTKCIHGLSCKLSAGCFARHTIADELLLKLSQIDWLTNLNSTKLRNKLQGSLEFWTIIWIVRKP